MGNDKAQFLHPEATALADAADLLAEAADFRGADAKLAEAVAAQRAGARGSSDPAAERKADAGVAYLQGERARLAQRSGDWRRAAELSDMAIEPAMRVSPRLGWTYQMQGAASRIELARQASDSGAMKRMVERLHDGVLMAIPRTEPDLMAETLARMAECLTWLATVGDGGVETWKAAATGFRAALEMPDDGIGRASLRFRFARAKSSRADATGDVALYRDAVAELDRAVSLWRKSGDAAGPAQAAEFRKSLLREIKTLERASRGRGRADR